MDCLADYYVRQAGGGHADDLFGPVYEGSPHVQLGHGIGSFLAGLFSAVRPLALRGAKVLGREALSAGANILSDIGSKSPDTKVKDISVGRLSESAQNLVAKLKGAGRKRKSNPSAPKSPPINRTRRRRKEGKTPSKRRATKKGNKGQYIRGDIFS
jgi:hypothetical protein